VLSTPIGATSSSSSSAQASPLASPSLTSPTASKKERALFGTCRTMWNDSPKTALAHLDSKSVCIDRAVYAVAHACALTQSKTPDVIARFLLTELEHLDKVSVGEYDDRARVAALSMTCM
jgi:hypothetical protein